MKMIFLLYVLFFYTSEVNSLHCFWNTGCPYKYFSSKTPYDFVRGDIRDGARILKERGCKPISIWTISRDGKKSPEPDSLLQMIEATKLREDIIRGYQNEVSSLCGQDVEDLQNWNSKLEILKSSNALTGDGYAELFGIAKRTKQAYSELLSGINKEGSYTIRSINEDIVERSARAYADGVIGRAKLDKSLTDFDILAPYKNCKRYQKEVQSNKRFSIEPDKYNKQLNFLAMLDRIQRRSGIDHNLSAVTAAALYNLCRYTSSGITRTFSPWCSIFTIEDLKVLEYAGDLKNYYRNGYGNPSNKIFGAPVLADLLTRFRQAKQGSGGKILTAYFTNQAMMEMIFSSLGMFQDDKPLIAAKRDEARMWRTSYFSTFSSNFVAVLNRCQRDGTPEQEYNVSLFLNEDRLLTLCEGGLCSWEKFERIFTPFLNSTVKNYCESE